MKKLWGNAYVSFDTRAHGCSLSNNAGIKLQHAVQGPRKNITKRQLLLCNTHFFTFKEYQVLWEQRNHIYNTSINLFEYLGQPLASWNFNYVFFIFIIFTWRAIWLVINRDGEISHFESMVKRVGIMWIIWKSHAIYCYSFILDLLGVSIFETVCIALHANFYDCDKEHLFNNFSKNACILISSFLFIL